jgi:hypothetical protein
MSHLEGGNYESGHSSHAGGDDYSGEVDGDEEGEKMQNVMAEEDMDGLADELSSNDSDEEEAVPIPSSWNQDFSNSMTVQDGHESNWEYHQNNITVGAIYSSKKHLKEAIINWAMNTKRVFRTPVSNPEKLTMVCENAPCPARVHAYVPKYDTKWLISDVQGHNCIIPYPPADHRNLSSTLISQLLYSEIVERKAQEVRAI